MSKLLVLIMIFSMSIMAMDEEEDRKMTPEEKRANNQRIERLRYPDEYPVSERVLVVRADECYENYAKLIKRIYSICEFFQSHAPNSAGRALGFINSAQNLYANNMALMVVNRDIPHLAMLTPHNSEEARRDLYGNNRAGSPSMIQLGARFHDQTAGNQYVTFAHELGHAYRAQIGHLFPPTGVQLSINNELWRPVGWWVEEIENTGLIESQYRFATENAFRREVGVDEINNYSGMTAEIFNRAGNFILNNPNGVGWHNLTDFYVRFY